MNWYKQAQVSVLGVDTYGELTLNVNGEIKNYQLPYSAIECHSDITNMIKRKQNKKLNKYLQWLEQFQLEEVKNMDVGVGGVISREESLSVVPSGF